MLRFKRGGRNPAPKGEDYDLLLCEMLHKRKQTGAQGIYLEYEHGDKKIKPQQQKMFEQAKAGDTIITLEVSRLARSTQQFCEIIEPVQLYAKDYHR